MLCDKSPFTLEATLASVDFFIAEYISRHDGWFSKTDNGELNTPVEEICGQRNINLYRYVHQLYQYVYHKNFDLNYNGDHFGSKTAYPYLDIPASIVVPVMFTYAFWVTFLGNDFYGTPYEEEAAQPLNQLITDAHLRCRIDFAWCGGFHAPNLKGITPRDNDGNDLLSPALFTYGELSQITSLSNSTLRGRITNNTSSTTDVRARSKDSNTSSGTVAIQPYGFAIPDSLRSFFEGKIGGGVKNLFAHREVISFIATNGDYLPTQFVAPSIEPFPSYDDSAHIHAAVMLWMSRYSKTARIEKLMQFIGATGINNDGSYSFWTHMESGKARLSLCMLSLINNYMLDVEGKGVRDNRWQPILDAGGRV